MSPIAWDENDGGIFSLGQQKGRAFFDVFSTNGRNPTAWWSQGKVSRHFAAEIRANYVSIGSDVMLPKPPKTCE
jgi:hypothetical protein